VAPAPGRAAARQSVGQAYGEAEAEPGNLAGDLALAAFGVQWS